LEAAAPQAAPHGLARVQRCDCRAEDLRDQSVHRAALSLGSAAESLVKVVVDPGNELSHASMIADRGLVLSPRSEDGAEGWSLLDDLRRI
jgi:hypothetical protein